MTTTWGRQSPPLGKLCGLAFARYKLATRGWEWNRDSAWPGRYVAEHPARMYDFYLVKDNYAVDREAA